MTRWSPVERMLAEGLVAGVYSAVSAEVGSGQGTLWSFSAGRSSVAADARPADAETIFDLASLTKVLATGAVAVQLFARGTLDVSTRVEAVLSHWHFNDRIGVTVGDLLEHASGLPAHRPYFLSLRGADAFLEALSNEPLEYLPRTQSVYSDLGFILLGLVLVEAGGAPLDVQFRAWRDAARIDAPLDFLPPREWLARTAVTALASQASETRLGEVDDGNARALGGVAAHAGLFGTARGVAQAARWWLTQLAAHRDGEDDSVGRTVQRFAQPSSVPGSSRALAWDTMRPTSSCGARMSASAIGHTGFTGTSLWLDPARDLYLVLLTNRVHLSHDSEPIQRIRREFHDRAIAELGTASTRTSHSPAMTSS